MPMNKMLRLSSLVCGAILLCASPSFAPGFGLGAKAGVAPIPPPIRKPINSCQNRMTLGCLWRVCVVWELPPDEPLVDTRPETSSDASVEFR